MPNRNERQLRGPASVLWMFLVCVWTCLLLVLAVLALGARPTGISFEYRRLNHVFQLGCRDGRISISELRQRRMTTREQLQIKLKPQDLNGRDDVRIGVPSGSFRLAPTPTVVQQVTSIVSIRLYVALLSAGTLAVALGVGTIWLVQASAADKRA